MATQDQYQNFLNKLNASGVKYDTKVADNYAANQGFATTQPTQAAQTAPVNAQLTTDDLAAQLIQQQQAAKLAALGSAYNTSMSKLSAEGKMIPGQYRDARTGVGVQGQKTARSFNEFMASRGLNRSGASAQGQLMNNVSVQQGKSDLYRDESNAVADLERRKSELEMGYQSGIAEAESLGASDLSKFKLESMMNKEKENKQMALDTLGRYSQDYTQGIIDIKGDGDPSNDWMIPYLESARSEKVAGIESSKAQAEAAQYEAAMDRWKLTGVADATVAALIGVPVGTPTSDYKFKAAQLELDKYKAYKTSGSGSGGSGGGEMTYKQFESEVLTTAESDPYLALKYVMDNAAFIKEEKGYDYYQKLYDRIRNLNGAYGAKNTSINIGSAPDIKNPGLGILNVYNKLY